MIPTLTAWLSKYALAILKGAGVALGVIAFLFSVKRGGRMIERVETLERELEDAKRANIIRQRVANLRSGDAAKRLRRGWKRSF